MAEPQAPLTDDELVGIQARLDNLLFVDTQEWYRPDVSRLLAEVRRTREMERRYQVHLDCIRHRWLEAKGTPLVGEWGLPWAMAADARAALEETFEAPCSACTRTVPDA